jgi:L-threonylcarbamoyladenylate synthase
METVRAFSELKALPEGGVVLAPTDTVYGLSCGVDDQAAVVRIKALKYRDANKPLIVLIASMRDLEKFGVQVTLPQSDFLKRVWPGPVSVVFAGINENYKHLATDGTLALRMPQREDLRAFIARVGPLVSTSANISGSVPATTVAEARAAFPEGLDYIVDTGTCDNPPSTVVRILR